MNCYNHPDRPAVVQCKRCGRGYCYEEAHLFIEGVCQECQRSEEVQKQQEERQRQEEERQILKEIITKNKEWHKKTVKYGLFAAVGTIVCIILKLLKIKCDSLLNFFLVMDFFVVYIRYGWRAFSILMKELSKRIPEGWGCIISFSGLILLFGVVSSITGAIFPFLYVYSIYVGYLKDRE